MEILVVRRGSFTMAPLEGESGDFALNDAFGKAEGAPFSFGMWEIRPSEDPVVTETANDCVAQYVLEGSVEAEIDGRVWRVAAGDFLFIPKVPDKEVTWRVTSGVFRAIYVTYPHWE